MTSNDEYLGTLFSSQRVTYSDFLSTASFPVALVLPSFLQYEAEDSNAMVFCDGCNVCVHQVSVTLVHVSSCMSAVLLSLKYCISIHPC